MSMDMNTSERSVTAGPVLTPGLMDLQKFMFSDSYHLTASTLARVCHLMMDLMLSKTSFNCCSTSLLLLLLNVFLKVRPMYFKETLLFQVSSSVQRAQQVNHSLVPPPL